MCPRAPLFLAVLVCPRAPLFLAVPCNSLQGLWQHGILQPQQSLTTCRGQTCPLTSLYNEAHQRVSAPGHRPQQSNCSFNRQSPLRPCAATGSAPQQHPHQLPAACPTGGQLSLSLGCAPGARGSLCFSYGFIFPSGFCMVGRGVWVLGLQFRVLLSCAGSVLHSTI